MRTLSDPVRYAVVGLGHIAQTAVLPAFRHSRNSKLVALITGDPRKESELSDRYGVPGYDYHDLEAAILREGVDVVYICLPNTLHRACAERAAAAKAHVLCEKPLAVTEEDCRAIMSAAEKNHVALMVAYRLHFTDAHVRAVELVRSGELGEIRFFNSLFAMQVKEENIRTRRDMGGGTLYDIGIYCINAARYLFQDEPEEVIAATGTRPDERFQEIEEMTSAVLRFPGDRLATFTCSFGSTEVDQLDIIGTKGTLQIKPAYTYSGPLTWFKKTNNRVEEVIFPAGDQFAGELTYFSDCLLNDKRPEPSGAEGVADVRIINALYESARDGRAIKIGAAEKTDRPDARQEIKHPPFKAPPKLVAAEAPHT
ncbi:MAG TPA: Gfo/Idh/MocA family oxidoreductase [Chthoniobacterales bacterium]